MNVTLDNAKVEGGPRNGVMTALDDFVAEHDQPLRMVVIPIYFGLAVVAKERLLHERPEFRGLVDGLESEAGRQDLLELSERIRIEATVFEHNIIRVRDEQLTAARERYLTLLRSTLLDQPYLENEVRIEYLLKHATEGLPVLADLLRAPESHLRKELLRLQRAARWVTPRPTTARRRSSPTPRWVRSSWSTSTPCSTRFATRASRATSWNASQVAAERSGRVHPRVPGGSRDPRPASLGREPVPVLTPHGRRARPLAEGGVDDLLADLTQVREAFDRFGLLDELVRFLQGDLALTRRWQMPPIDEIALVRIGAGFAADSALVLDRLYDRVTNGGFVVVEDTSRPGCTRPSRSSVPVDASRAQSNGSGGRARCGARMRWQHRVLSPSLRRAGTSIVHPSRPAPARSWTCGGGDLAIRREGSPRPAVRCTRTYRRDVRRPQLRGHRRRERVRAGPERLGDEFVAERSGPEFRYLDLGA